MKKTIAFFLGIAMLCTLVGCANKANDATAELEGVWSASWEDENGVNTVNLHLVSTNDKTGKVECVYILDKGITDVNHTYYNGIFEVSTPQESIINLVYSEEIDSTGNVHKLENEIEISLFFTYNDDILELHSEQLTFRKQ